MSKCIQLFNTYVLNQRITPANERFSKVYAHLESANHTCYIATKGHCNTCHSYLLKQDHAIIIVNQTQNPHLDNYADHLTKARRIAHKYFVRNYASKFPLTSDPEYHAPPSAPTIQVAAQLDAPAAPPAAICNLQHMNNHTCPPCNMQHSPNLHDYFTNPLCPREHLDDHICEPQLCHLPHLTQYEFHRPQPQSQPYEPLTLSELQEYVIASANSPNISPQTADFMQSFVARFRHNQIISETQRQTRNAHATSLSSDQSCIFDNPASTHGSTSLEASHHDQESDDNEDDIFHDAIDTFEQQLPEMQHPIPSYASARPVEKLTHFNLNRNSSPTPLRLPSYSPQQLHQSRTHSPDHMFGLTPTSQQSRVSTPAIAAPHKDPEFTTFGTFGSLSNQVPRQKTPPSVFTSRVHFGQQPATFRPIQSPQPTLPVDYSIWALPTRHDATSTNQPVPTTPSSTTSQQLPPIDIPCPRSYSCKHCVNKTHERQPLESKLRSRLNVRDMDQNIIHRDLDLYIEPTHDRQYGFDIDNTI